MRYEIRRSFYGVVRFPRNLFHVFKGRIPFVARRSMAFLKRVFSLLSFPIRFFSTKKRTRQKNDQPFKTPQIKKLKGPQSEQGSFKTDEEAESFCPQIRTSTPDKQASPLIDVKEDRQAVNDQTFKTPEIKKLKEPQSEQGFFKTDEEAESFCPQRRTLTPDKQAPPRSKKTYRDRYFEQFDVKEDRQAAGDVLQSIEALAKHHKEQILEKLLLVSPEKLLQISLPNKEISLLYGLQWIDSVDKNTNQWIQGFFEKWLLDDIKEASEVEAICQICPDDFKKNEKKLEEFLKFFSEETAITKSHLGIVFFSSGTHAIANKPRKSVASSISQFIKPFTDLGKKRLLQIMVKQNISFEKLQWQLNRNFFRLRTSLVFKKNYLIHIDRLMDEEEQVFKNMGQYLEDAPLDADDILNYIFTIDRDTRKHISLFLMEFCDVRLRGLFPVLIPTKKKGLKWNLLEELCKRPKQVLSWASLPDKKMKKSSKTREGNKLLKECIEEIAKGNKQFAKYLFVLFDIATESFCLIQEEEAQEAFEINIGVFCFQKGEAEDWYNTLKAVLKEYHCSSEEEKKQLDTPQSIHFKNFLAEEEP